MEEAGSVAILVRTRDNLLGILPCLRAAGLPCAVEIESLGRRRASLRDSVEDARLALGGPACVEGRIACRR